MTRHALALLALAPAYLALAATVTVKVPSATDVELETIPTEVDLGPDYYEDPDWFQQEVGTVTLGTWVETPAASTVEVLTTSYKTPATSTIYSETVSTSTPATRTVTVDETPASSTVYETSWTTSQPATSTVTAFVSAATGNAACLEYRLVFPASCCPSSYVKLGKLGRRQVDLEGDTTVTVTEGTLYTTFTAYETEYAPRPEVPVSSIAYVYRGTVTAPRPTIMSTSTIVSEAATPLVTVPSVRVVVAAEPVVTETATAQASTQTVTLTSTSTLATPVTTTTSTLSAQATACAQKTVWTQKACPASVLVKNLVQDVQVAKLNLYKALGGKSVIVDCGSAGTFRY
ncbi:hypothetical protein JCM8208_003645 [Rhodotorula glutinis]